MSSLRRIAPFVKPYSLVLILGLLTVVLPVTMELLVPRLLQYIIDSGITAGDMHAITVGSVAMLVTALIGALATLGQGVFRAQLSQGIAYDMRNALFRHIQSLSFANLDRMQTGRLMTRISSDVDVVRMFLSAGLALLLRALLMILGSVLLMMWSNPRLSSIVWVVLMLAAVLIWGVMRLARPLFTVVQRRLANLNTVVQENLAGVRVVKAYAREPYEVARFGDGNAQLMAQNIKVGRLMAITMPALLVLTNVGLAAILWWGGLETIQGYLTVGELVAFCNYLMIGMAPLMLLGNMLMMVSRAEASAERVLEVLDTEPAVKVAPAPHRAPRIEGRVEFDDVVFRYAATEGRQMDQAAPQGNGQQSGGRYVLNGVSFSARPGQRIALLGATGSGKSTLVQLIPRFYDAEAGDVRIDGVSVRDWAPDVLRRRVSMVLQQTTLFSGTVRDNIAYGRPDASLEQVMAAARAAQAHDFILAMPEGYESRVEAQGANLSGGQKQRLAIARALLAEPRILVLDDCTSSVDLDTEFKIQQALDEVANGCTTFIVAQRINSVLNADQILVLDDGHIVARGTHRELLRSSPIYQEIYRSQIGEDGTGEQPLAEVQTAGAEASS